MSWLDSCLPIASGRATLAPGDDREARSRLDRSKRGSGLRVRNHPDDEHRFFREVAQALETHRQILVVGPSKTKLHFFQFSQQHDRALAERIVGLETMDHPTVRRFSRRSRFNLPNGGCARLAVTSNSRAPERTPIVRRDQRGDLPPSRPGQVGERGGNAVGRGWERGASRRRSPPQARAGGLARTSGLAGGRPRACSRRCRLRAAEPGGLPGLAAPTTDDRATGLAPCAAEPARLTIGGGDQLLAAASSWASR